MQLYIYILPVCFVVVIVAFDLSDLESLSNSRQWCEDACQHAEDPLVFLVGTKKDLLVGCMIICSNYSG